MTKTTFTTISPNGYHAETKASGRKPGAFVIPTARPRRTQSQPTQFLPEYEGTSWRTFLYNISRHHFGTIPLTRWVSNMLMMGFLVTGLIWLGGWFFAQNMQPRMAGFSLFCLTGAVAWGATLAQLRRQDFVEFIPETLPTFTPEKLGAEDKISVYVTGQFSVEGKGQRYTNLPGFYRTFTTREHALLCRRRPSNFLRFCRWPGEEIGMWYIFFTPQLIQQVHWGKLHFGKTPSPAIAIDYQITQPSSNPLQRARTQTETVYLMWTDEDDGLRILADLLYDIEPACL